MRTENKVRRCVYLLLAVILAGCIAVLFPQVRRMVIHLTEQFIVQRPLQDHDSYMQLLFNMSSTVILCVGLGLVI